MSYGSRRPARYDRTRERVRELRTQLVRQVGCVHGSCPLDAIELVSDHEWMAVGCRPMVRIPRSLRKYAKK
jgi:radical SAM superfamily enzyme YgiQ (UPF0313 family)